MSSKADESVRTRPPARSESERVSLMVVVSIVIVPVTVASLVVVSMIMFAVSFVPMLVVSLVPMLVVIPAALVIRLVFCGSYEVHRPITGIILSAIPAPIPRMTGRHVQIDGRRRGLLRHDQHRLRINQGRRRVVADLNLAVDTGCHLSRQNDLDT